MLIPMPFDIDKAYNDIYRLDLEHILKVFRKPWKKMDFEMDKFHLAQETIQGRHPDYDCLYNDGNYTLRLFYDSLPVASIGTTVEDGFIKVLQIQGVRYEDDIGHELMGYLNDAERLKIRHVLESFYWSHVLLSATTDHLFNMGVDDIRVMSFNANPDNGQRKNHLSLDDAHTAFVTYDLTALTLGFNPMRYKKNIPRYTIATDTPLSFHKDGHPNKDVTFYYMRRGEFEGGIIDRLVNGQEPKSVLRNIHKCLGDYRQRELNFNVYVENCQCVTDKYKSKDSSKKSF